VALVVPNPQYVDWDRWAETLIGYNDPLQNQLSLDLDWPDFAARLALIFPATPHPELFEDWRDWATALLQTLQ
jgi:hypothetical protein